ncbi:MAG: hypothetical protein AM325_009940 [Candidatus Thorarchaeota archaeon SMTZ1-45]|nr:MAG: hypothetical protein AM325_11525 [Candidatus Thorarchaeota archaeon SMTZ1-45]
MTKSSDRYARWFGTRVPLVSRGGIALLTFLTALPYSVVLYFIFEFTIITSNWITALFITLNVGFIIHILILLLLKIRFNNPSTNSEFNALVGQVYQKVVLPSRAHIWTRQSEESFIATSFNPLFDAVIVSEPMVDLILKTPGSGEALLAFHLLRVPRTRWIADLFGSLILFLIFTYPSSLLLVPFTITIAQSIMIGYFYTIMYALSTFASFFMVPIILVLLLKGTFWRHDLAFDGIQEIYGIHPNVAKVHIERGYPLTEDEAQTVVWGVRDWEKRRRGSRRVGVSTLAAIGSFLLGYIPLFLLLGGGYYPYSPYLYFFLYLPYIFALVGILISYLLLRRWDKNAMGEVFKKTTDYDEPIWVD